MSLFSDKFGRYEEYVPEYKGRNVAILILKEFVLNISLVGSSQEKEKQQCEKRAALYL